MQHQSSLFDFQTVDYSRRAQREVPSRHFKPKSRFGLIVIGRLYQDQIIFGPNQPHPTLTQLRLLASITDLCQSRFAQQHDGQINLSNAIIATKSGGYFSPRQVSDHLNALKMLGLVTIDFDEGRRWIGIKRPGLDTLPEKVAHKFVPWVDFEQGLIPELNISEQFVLSYLANEACIFARSEMGLSLPLSNVINTGRSLIQNQVLSRDSFNRALNSLQEKGCINMVNGKNNPYLILNFDGRYQALLRVDPSHNANFITNQWAMRRIADRVDNPATRCERAIMAKLVTRDQQNLVDVLFNLPERNGW